VLYAGASCFFRSILSMTRTIVAYRPDEVARTLAMALGIAGIGRFFGQLRPGQVLHRMWNR
jgi:hypothetical protein